MSEWEGVPIYVVHLNKLLTVSANVLLYLLNELRKTLKM